MQAMLPTISSDVAALNESLQQKTSSFKYLVRLRELVIAYAATVVEIVRRREFGASRIGRTRHELTISSSSSPSRSFSSYRRRLVQALRRRATAAQIVSKRSFWQNALRGAGDG